MITLHQKNDEYITTTSQFLSIFYSYAIQVVEWDCNEAYDIVRN